MMRRIILTLGCMALMASMSQAMNLELTPGSLRGSLNDLKNTKDTELKLTGSCNVTDLALLKDMSRTITYVDLSALSIEAYDYGASGDYMGQKSFTAAELPPYIFAGSSACWMRLPASLTSIGEMAFAGSALKSVSVPANVRKIGDAAFANCRDLATVVIPSEASLGIALFKDCTSLPSVDFGYDVTSIPESAFDGCSSYTAALPASVTEVGPYAFRGTAIRTLDLDNMESIGEFAFAEMPDLEEISFNSMHDMSVGAGAFYNDPAVVSLPDWSGAIPALVLAGGGGSDRLIIGHQSIGEAAYANNPNVRTLAFRNGVSNIGAHAFRNMSALEQVDVTALGKAMPEIDPLAFSGLENESGRYDIALNVAKDTNDTWKAHPVWGLFDIQNMSTGLGGIEATPMVVAVKRDGGTVNVSTESVIDYIGIFAFDGMTLLEATPEDSVFSADGFDPAQPLLVKVVCGGKVKVVKLR